MSVTIPLKRVCDNYSWAEAISLLRNNRVVILSAGTGNQVSSLPTCGPSARDRNSADVVLKDQRMAYSPPIRQKILPRPCTDSA